MKKIAILGGAGFIGSHIAERAANENIETLIIDNLQTGNLTNISSILALPHVNFIHASIEHHELLAQALADIDTVFHLAARTSVAESMTQEIDYVKANSIGTLNVLKSCLANRVANLVFSSSAAIYGDPTDSKPLTEDLKPEPKSIYAVTKLDGERFMTLYGHSKVLRTVSLRYFNVFGPRQDANSGYAAAIPIFIKKALANETITINGDGEQTRDFIPVSEIVNANFSGAEKGSGIYNACRKQTLSINQLAEKIIQLTGSKSKVEHGAPQPGDIKHSCGDNSKIIKELNIQFDADFDQCLVETIAYYQQQVTPYDRLQTTA